MPTSTAFRKHMASGIAALAILVGIAGCGREAPRYAPGNLTVTSTPAGARIWLDGVDTGQVTPHTFVGLAAEPYDVSVSLVDFVSSPSVVPVDLQPLDDVNVAFLLSQTGLAVASDPPGARILLDGIDSGEVTPAVLVGLAPGLVEVSLELDTYLVAPSTFEVEIVDGEVADVATSAFAFRSRKTVVLEGFANVNCAPCPELTENLLALTAQPGFGPDRIVYIEFSVNWPNPADPLYLANPGENTDRYTDYVVLGAPALYLDGTARDDALDIDGLALDVEGSWSQDPGFLVDVTADFTNPSVPVTVTLDPAVDRDLTGYELFVALYESVVTYATAPGSNGQTEFHHVFRDRVNAPSALGALVAGSPQPHAATLDRGARDPANLVVLAFVQNSADLTVLQAGSSMQTAKAAARMFRERLHRSERIRP